jgi:mannitol-1-/sugar-/sorbitol-6-phosphatase
VPLWLKSWGMLTFRCAGILFDLDGVLVDSTGAVEREWREWAARKGVDGDSVMAIAHGVRTIEVIRHVAPHLDAGAEAAAIENHEADDQTGVVVMPGALALLQSIPGNRWGVVTSGSRLLAQNRLRYCGLPIPDVLVTSDDVAHGKPHPEPYLKGAAKLGRAPADCLVIEDAPAGIQSGHAGGMKVIALASTYSWEKLAEADAVIQGFDALSVHVSDQSLVVTTATSSGLRITFRQASLADRAAMAALINAAFAIETFLEGTRTNEDQLANMMQKGVFVLAEDSEGNLVGSAYIELRGVRGYFGMLAVHPPHQGRGIGRSIVEAAELFCRNEGCLAMDLTILSLRTELPPFYRKLGYVESGVEEFRSSRPFRRPTACHCIVMSKAL